MRGVCQCFNMGQHVFEFSFAFVLYCGVECLKLFAGQYDPALVFSRVGNVESFVGYSSSGIRTHTWGIERFFRPDNPITPCCDSGAACPDIDICTSAHELEAFSRCRSFFIGGEEFVSGCIVCQILSCSHVAKLIVAGLRVKRDIPRRIVVCRSFGSGHFFACDGSTVGIGH